MSVFQLMSKDLITLDLDDDLADAKRIFEQHNIHHILILNGKELAGVVSDRDVFKNLSPTIGTSKETPRDSSLLRKKMHLVMSRDLVTTDKDCTLNEAVLLFYKHKISCLPVVNSDYHPEGIITWRDIIKVIALQYLKKKTTGE